MAEVKSGIQALFAGADFTKDGKMPKANVQDVCVKLGMTVEEFEVVFNDICGVSDSDSVEVAVFVDSIFSDDKPATEDKPAAEEQAQPAEAPKEAAKTADPAEAKAAEEEAKPAEAPAKVTSKELEEAKAVFAKLAGDDGKVTLMEFFGASNNELLKGFNFGEAAGEDNKMTFDEFKDALVKAGKLEEQAKEPKEEATPVEAPKEEAKPAEPPTEEAPKEEAKPSDEAKEEAKPASEEK